MGKVPKAACCWTLALLYSHGNTESKPSPPYNMNWSISRRQVLAWVLTTFSGLLALGKYPTYWASLKVFNSTSSLVPKGWIIAEQHWNEDIYAKTMTVRIVLKKYEPGLSDESYSYGQRLT